MTEWGNAPLRAEVEGMAREAAALRPGTGLGLVDASGGPGLPMGHAVLRLTGGPDDRRHIAIEWEAAPDGTPARLVRAESGLDAQRARQAHKAACRRHLAPPTPPSAHTRHAAALAGCGSRRGALGR